MGEIAMSGKPMNPGSFLFCMIKQWGITTEELAGKMGYSPATINNRINAGSWGHPLNTNFAQKLAHLTDKDMLFWMKSRFTLEDVNTTHYFQERDASHIAETKGGSHAAHLERQREKMKEMRGVDKG